VVQRYSKKREDILNVLMNAHGALSATALHSRLPKLDLTTIYRNLEVFVAQGDVKRLNLKGNEAIYEYQERPHHHAVCTECGQVMHFTAPDEKIKKLLGIPEFKIDELEVTVRGVCTHKK
jgi:Fe2+ or Zn2+ uptake regulation protein